MTQTDAEFAAIHALVQRAHEAQDDPDALLDLHTDDAVIVNIAGRRVLGRPAFADAMRAAIASPLRDVHTSLEVRDVRRPTADTALVSCIKLVHDERDEAGAVPLPAQGALSYLLVRQDGDWRIALAQTTPIRDFVTAGAN